MGCLLTVPAISEAQTLQQAATLQVATLLRYFDEDLDGRLSKAELARLWAAVSSERKLTERQYAAACRKVGAKPRQGLDAESLWRLYEQGFADLDEHFKQFVQVREFPEDPLLRKQLKAQTKPSCCPQRVARLAHLGDGSCVVLSHEPQQLFLLDRGSLKGLRTTPDWISSHPSASKQRGLLVFEEGKFKVLEIDRERRDKPKMKLRHPGILGGFPKQWGKVEEDEDEDIWDACIGADGAFHLAALARTEDTPKARFFIDEEDDESGESSGDEEPDGSDEQDRGGESSLDEEPPVVYPKPARWRRLVAAHGSKRLEVCKVPFRASMLSLSEDGLCAAYQVPVSDVPEEGNRGEWYVCGLTPGAVPRRISQGPTGRVGGHPARFSPGGRYVVYQANHSQSRPITQHMDLWLVDLQLGETAPAVRITPGSMQIDAFGWVNGRADALWLSTTSGPDLQSFTLSLQSGALERMEPAAAFKSLPSWNPRTGKCVYPVESATEFEGLWDEQMGQRIQLAEWSRQFEDICVEALEYVGPGGRRVRGAVYYSTGHQGQRGGSRALLVWVHGGPTCPWPVLRGNFSNDARLGEPNFTSLVRAGYLLFVPLYRGTLGFGDDWSTANIRCQGSRDGDLGDILAGVARLRALGLHGCGSSAGIFGESYGGYMAIKALSDREGAEVFQCGASMYGYINNRETTLLTGDFTWEEEFIGSAAQWPPPVRDEDCHNELGNISGPLLLLHGDEDNVCPVSHSTQVYQALRQRGVPTELAVYHKQGHGFEGEKVQRDVVWRILQWFLRHLPPDGSSPPERRV